MNTTTKYKHIAAELNKISDTLGLPILFFRAGTAASHDSLKEYVNIGKFIKTEFYISEDKDIFKICALISRAQILISTSMHTRIIAYAFQRPRMTLDTQSK